MDFTFEQAAWEAAIDKIEDGGSISAAQLLTLLEGENEADVEEALEKCQKFEDVEKSFQEVQAITHCSTGCGGCHDKILDTISEIMGR